MRVLRISSIVLEWFVAVSAFAGAYMVASTNGKAFGLGLDWLGNIFPSYVVPGIILGVVVGGTQAVAALAEMGKRGWAREATAIASLGLLIWFFVELYILKHTNWLQILYYAMGVATLILLLVRMKYEPARA